MAGLIQFFLILAAVIVAAGLFGVLFAVAWAVGTIFLWTQGRHIDD